MDNPLLSPDVLGTWLTLNYSKSHEHPFTSMKTSCQHKYMNGYIMVQRRHDVPRLRSCLQHLHPHQIKWQPAIQYWKYSQHDICEYLLGVDPDKSPPCRCLTSFRKCFLVGWHQKLLPHKPFRWTNTSLEYKSCSTPGMPVTTICS